MLNIINFNMNEPWNYDFYRAAIEAETTEQEIADAICGAIPELRSIPFFRIHSSVYFVVPTGTSIPENMLNSIEQITDVLTEAEFIAAQAAAELEAQQSQSETPTE